jgi:hypothetical protein
MLLASGSCHLGNNHEAIECLGCIRSQDLCVILFQGPKFLARYKIQDLCVILFRGLKFLAQYKIQVLCVILFQGLKFLA